MSFTNIRSRKSNLHSATDDSQTETATGPVDFATSQEDEVEFKEKTRTDLGNFDDNDNDTFQSTVLLVIIFIGAIVSMGIIYHNFPPVKAEDAGKIKVPKSMGDAQDLGRVLSNYKDDYFMEVVLAFMVTYILSMAPLMDLHKTRVLHDIYTDGQSCRLKALILQSFAIPGSIFLSILSGFLFPFPLALFLVCLCSSVGASLCYILSSLVGKRLVKRYFPERVAKWKKEIAKHDKDFLSYIIFLRITPFLPNWFINVTSPVLNVSLWPFFLGTFIGVAPPSFGFVSAGVELYELTTYGDAFSFRSILLVVVSAVLSLAPVLLRKFFTKMENTD